MNTRPAGLPAILLFAAATALSEMKLPPCPPNGEMKMPLADDSFAARHAVVRNWLAANLEGYRADDPAVKILAHTLAFYCSKSKTTGQAAFNPKYYDWVGNGFGTVETVRRTLAERPAAYRLAWIKWYAERAIAYRIPYDRVQVRKRMEALPPGEVVTVGDTTVLRRRITARYGTADAATVMILADLNPALVPGARYVGDKSKETRVFGVTTIAGREWIYPVDLAHRGAVVLFPDKTWMQRRTRNWRPEPTGTTTHPVRRYHYLQVEGLGFEGVPAVLKIGIDADGKVADAVVLYPSLNNRCSSLIPLKDTTDGIDRTWLTFSHGLLSGGCRVAPGRYGGNDKLLKLNVIIAGAKTSGTCTVWVTDDKHTNTFTAKVTAAAEPAGMAPVNGVWPGLFGPTGTGATGEKVRLVNNLEDAALGWVSDHQTPDGRGVDLRGKPKRVPLGEPIMGGWASPVVAANIVALSYYRPSGPYAFNLQSRKKPDEDEQWRINRIHADDIAHAFDAATGKTKWITTMVDSGINWSSFNKGGPMSSPGIGDGRLVTLGTLGKVFCFDLETGALQWQTDIGLRHDLMVELRRQATAAGTVMGSRNDFQSGVTIVDGVAVVSDQMRTKIDYRYTVQNGLIGFDLHTGRRLWHIPEVAGQNSCQQGAQLLPAGGKVYLLAGNREGTTVLDPGTGRILARQPGLINAHWGYGVADGLVIGDKLERIGKDKAAYHPVAAYRFSEPGGFRKAWELPRAYGKRVGGGLALNGKVYIQVFKPSPQVLCLDPASGKILGHVEAEIAGGEHCPFIIGGDAMVLLCRDRTAGYLTINSDPQKMSRSLRTWNSDLATGYCGSLMPALADGRLFYRSRDRLLCLDLRRDHVPQRPFGHLWKNRNAPKSEKKKSGPAPKKPKMKPARRPQRGVPKMNLEDKLREKDADDIDLDLD